MSKFGALLASILSLSVIAVAVYLWISLGDVTMGLWGWAALIGGGLSTLALGIGLMALLFYSHRAGFDERAAGVRLIRPEDEPGSEPQPAMENGPPGR